MRARARVITHFRAAEKTFYICIYGDGGALMCVFVCIYMGMQFCGKTSTFEFGRDLLGDFRLFGC